MRKKLLTALMLVLFVLWVSGCAGLPPEESGEEPFPPEANDCDDGQCAEEVEEKAVEEIEESEDITALALEMAITEQQVLVSQDDFERVLEEEALEDPPEPLEAPAEPAEPVYEVVESYKTELPESLVLDLKYDRYPSSYDYLLVLTEILNIREAPSVESAILDKAYYFEKVNLEASVRGQYLERYDSDLWYRIYWKEGEEVRKGYVFAGLAEPRTYQFEKMLEKVEILKETVEASTTAYISNYKNRNGLAPLYRGMTEDAFGTVRSQSAPAYWSLEDKGAFRYLEDGTLLTVFGKNEAETHYQVRTVEENEELWVPKRYVSFSNTLETLEQVVVVDRRNQNEGVFEFIDGSWHLISYIFATTGEQAQFKQPTSLGYWMAITTQPQFIYLDDITREIAGYAPYTIRFNAGAYIHGVPVNYVKRNGQNIDPGKKEYLFTIGTVPRSHKCVRNYTSHAKFLYEWIKIGRSAIIVIE